jgi:hypothetical protein
LAKNGCLTRDKNARRSDSFLLAELIIQMRPNKFPLLNKKHCRLLADNAEEGGEKLCGARQFFACSGLSVRPSDLPENYPRKKPRLFGFGSLLPAESKQSEEVAR